MLLPLLPLSHPPEKFPDSLAMPAREGEATLVPPKTIQST
jgi:hypothetical protein